VSTAQKVMALNPVTSGVSVVSMKRGNPIPALRYLTAGAVADRPTLATALARIEALAAETVALAARAEPDLLILPTLIIGPRNSDTSGPRRAGLFWSIVRHAEAAGIPVAAFPPFTVQRWFGDMNPKPGHAGHRKLSDTAKRRWPGVNMAMPDQFRYDTLALAAIGCAAAGIPTAQALTEDRLKLLRSGDWPTGITLPRTVAEWERLYGPSVPDFDNEEQSA
jgi:hypothetical protein